MALQTRKAGALERGVMVALIGDRGSGKTTLAASFPKPVVLAVEDGTQVLERFGTDVVDVRGEGVKDTMLGFLREAYRSEFKTVVIDSATALLERMTWDLVKDEPPLKQNLGAAGKGFYERGLELVTELGKLLRACERLHADKQINVVWVLHQTVISVPRTDEDDIQKISGEGYKRAIDSLLNPCDLVGMVQLVHTRVKKGSGGVKVVGDGSREIVVGSHPALATKSRWHKTLTTIPVEFGVNPLPDIVK